MKMINLAMALTMGVQVQAMNKEEAPLLSASSSRASHYSVLKPHGLKESAEKRQEQRSDDPNAYSFYANLPVREKNDRSNGSIGVSIENQQSDNESKSDSGSKGDEFFRLCVRHLILNGQPMAKKSKWTALNLSDLELATKDDVGIFLKRNESLHNAKGNFAILKEDDLKIFAPTELNLAYNKELSELPLEISQLTSLTKLSLAGNSFKKIPGVVNQLANLEDLDVSENEFLKDITAMDVKECKKLKNLYYSGLTQCATTLISSRIAKKKA